MRHFYNIIFIFLFLGNKIFAAPYTTAPMEAFKTGIFTNSNIANFRAGYLYDNIYREKLKENNEDETNISYLKLRSNGALFTLNIRNRWDLYSFLGFSKLKLDNQVKTSNNFAFYLGTKIDLFSHGNFNVIIDGKYFQTKQKVAYFLIENKIYPIRTPKYNFLYENYQAALGISYRINYFIPYIAASYLYSTLTPGPCKNRVVFRYPYPDQEESDDIDFSEHFNTKRWGCALGLNIISKDTISITMESRLINQNAFSISTELRF